MERLYVRGSELVNFGYAGGFLQYSGQQGQRRFSALFVHDRITRMISSLATEYELVQRIGSLCPYLIQRIKALLCPMH